MDFENISWDIFKLTGDIESYLLHREIKNAREKEWKASKQEQSSQDGQTMRSQTVC